jgi:hypothetical protein
MKNHAPTKAEYLTRNEVLASLSDQEVAAVSTAETAERLPAGAEYLDLGHLDLGVRHAASASTPAMGRVLPKAAIHHETWVKILGLLPTSRVVHES